MKWLTITLVLFGFGGVLELKDAPLIGGLGLVFAVLGVAVFAPGVVRPRSLVRIGPEGFEQCGLRRQFVPWSEITDISAIKRELGGAKLKSVCVVVRDPDKVVHGASRALLRAGESRWWSPIFKLVFGAFLLVAEGPAAVKDLKDVAKSDVKIRGIVEIPTSAGFPMSADDLAALLRQCQQRYAQAPAAREHLFHDPEQPGSPSSPRSGTSAPPLGPRGKAPSART